MLFCYVNKINMYVFLVKILFFGIMEKRIFSCDFDLIKFYILKFFNELYLEYKRKF